MSFLRRLSPGEQAGNRGTEMHMWSLRCDPWDACNTHVTVVCDRAVGPGWRKEHERMDLDSLEA